MEYSACYFSSPALAWCAPQKTNPDFEVLEHRQNEVFFPQIITDGVATDHIDFSESIKNTYV